MEDLTLQKITNAVLVAADTGVYDVETSLAELEALAESAGLAVEGTLVQKRTGYDPATVIGKGRLEELAEYCSLQEIDVAVFDCELSPSQMRNIEELLKTAVLDRTALILDIFATHAVTSEGKLQVELAQLAYRLPRLAGLGKALSRLGGGIGTRGPGETKLESDRRHIHRRMSALKEELAELEKRRLLRRSRRKKEGVTTVAIVGYTNVGKSTLLNTLTDAGALAENKLFATLDPTSRALNLPDGRSVLLIDTVGFVRRLPHTLVEAFKSTLEEAAAADLLWCVCDASSEEAEEQITLTRKLMEELGAAEVPMLVVLNKCDCVSKATLRADEDTVHISAKTGFGLEMILEKTGQKLHPMHTRGRFLVPYAQGGLVNEVLKNGKIFSQEHTEHGVLMEALVDNKILYKLKGMEMNG